MYIGIKFIKIWNGFLICITCTSLAICIGGLRSTEKEFSYITTHICILVNICLYDCIGICIFRLPPWCWAVQIAVHSSIKSYLFHHHFWRDFGSNFGYDYLCRPLEFCLVKFVATNFTEEVFMNIFFALTCLSTHFRAVCRAW